MRVACAKKKTTLSNIVIRVGSFSWPPATCKMELFVTNLHLQAFNYCRKELDFK